MQDCFSKWLIFGIFWKEKCMHKFYQKLAMWKGLNKFSKKSFIKFKEKIVLFNYKLWNPHLKSPLVILFIPFFYKSRFGNRIGWFSIGSWQQRVQASLQYCNIHLFFNLKISRIECFTAVVWSAKHIGSARERKSK